MVDVEKFKSKYIDKLIKIESNEGRVVIGKMKSVDDQGNIYLIETVEVFSKDSDQYFKFDLYENHPDHLFYFESIKNNYQLHNNCIVPMKEVMSIFMLKSKIE